MTVIGSVLTRPRTCGMLACVVAVALMTACGGLLDVTNPTLIRPEDIANAAGANSLRGKVVLDFMGSVIFAANQVALLTDERQYDTPSPSTGDPADQLLDQRQSEQYEDLATTGDRGDLHLGYLDAVLTESSPTIASIRVNTPDTLRGDFLGQMYAFRGFAIAQMAEDICPGFPINDVTGTNVPIYSKPYTTDSALTLAVTQLDSALKYVHDSTYIRSLAQVTKGRVLLDLGQYAQAATAVSGVPTTFSYATDPDYGTSLATSLWSGGIAWAVIWRKAVGEMEGGNGLPFVSAHDTRVQTQFGTVRSNTTTDSLYYDLKYTAYSTPMVISSGIEARLIEAEAALHEPNPTQAFAILDALRATVGLGALADPGTDAARVDLLYRERAFWLYVTGRRLGDLRRLIRNYGRSAESVFPTGSYPSGGGYGSATAIPFILSNQAKYNPNITTGCTTR